MDTINLIMTEINLFLGKLSNMDERTWFKFWFIYVIFLWCAIIIWVIRDISARWGGLLWQLVGVLLVIFLTPILWLPLYLLIRPQYSFYNEPEQSTSYMDSYVTQSEEKVLITCPTCWQIIDEDFNFCPHCEEQLKASCNRCRKMVRKNWRICPYCGNRHFSEEIKKTEKDKIKD